MEYEDQQDIYLWKITNSLGILRLRKPIKTSTRFAATGFEPGWDFPNASLLRYYGVMSLGTKAL